MSDLFGKKAQEWDANDTIKQLSSAVGLSILKSVDLNAQMQVMDFGAGTGLITSHIAPHVKSITAVDISRAMLEKLSGRPELVGKVKIVCQDITELPLDTKFDLIVSAMAMHHVKETDRLIQRFAEHLKPGSVVALADLDYEDGNFHPEGTEGIFHHGFKRDELKALLEKQGFKNITFTTVHSVMREEREYPIFLVTAEL